MADWKSIDEKIAQKLENFSEAPPSGGWKRVREGLDAGSEGPAAISGHWFSMPFLWRAAAIGLIAGISVVFFLAQRSGANPHFVPRQEMLAEEKNQPESIESVQSKDKLSFENFQQQRKESRHNQVHPSHSSTNPNPSSGVISPQKQKSETIVTTKKNSKPISPKQASPNLIIQKKEPKIVINNSLKNLELSGPIVQMKIEQKISSHNQEVLNKEAEAEHAEEKQITLDSNLNETTKEIALKEALIIPDMKEQTKQEFIRSRPYSVGLLLNVHQIFNTADALEKGNASYGIGLAGRYHFSEQYYFESGFGLEQSKDGWDYIVDYRKEELVGYYQDVDSVSYQIVTGSTGQDSVILQYHTHQQAVYDTVDGSMKDISTRQYTYFTIPLMLGYQNSFKRFHYSVSTGLLMALTIHEKSNVMDIDKSGLQVLKTRNEVYHRVKTHWQYALNLGLGYRFHHQWYFAIEPELRVSVQDLYQNSGEISSKKPYSVGIRTGVFYRF